jgi:hypothetical protein
MGGEPVLAAKALQGRSDRRRPRPA